MEIDYAKVLKEKLGESFDSITASETEFENWVCHMTQNREEYNNLHNKYLIGNKVKYKQCDDTIYISCPCCNHHILTKYIGCFDYPHFDYPATQPQYCPECGCRLEYLEAEEYISSCNQNSESLKKHLLEQGVWECEIDEILNVFNGDTKKKDLDIATIYACTYDLAVNYVNDIYGELDYYIKTVLDYEQLGERIAVCGDGYLLLSSGRVIQFKN